MNEPNIDQSSNDIVEAAPVYSKPQLKNLGSVGEMTKASSTFSNIADSSNTLGSDYS